MPKNYLTVAISLFILLLGSMSASDVDVTGDWEMTMESPRGGEMTRAVHFEQDGEKITVTMESRRGDEVTAEGTIKGNAIEWTVSRETPRGSMTLTYKGTVEGDTMSGTVEFGDFGSGDWTAKRL
jgi:L-seryl-tRNA(Ser) seleniumtransferase